MDPLITDPNQPQVIPGQTPDAGNSGQPPAQPQPTPQDPQAALEAEWAKMSPEAQQQIATAIFEQGKAMAIQQAQEQGLLMDPSRPKDTPPSRPVEPDENPFLKQFENKVGEVLQQIDKLDPKSAGVLRKALSMTVHEAVKGSAGVSQQLTQDQMEKLIAPYNEFMVEQRKSQYFSQNPHMLPLKEQLDKALSRENVNAWEISDLISSGIKQGIDSFRKEYEARLQMEPDVYGGFVEQNRGRITPQSMADLKQLDEAALKAAKEGNTDALNAALRKRWERPPG